CREGALRVVVESLPHVRGDGARLVLGDGDACTLRCDAGVVAGHVAVPGDEVLALRIRVESGVVALPRLGDGGLGGGFGRCRVVGHLLALSSGAQRRTSSTCLCAARAWEASALNP